MHKGMPAVVPQGRASTHGLWVIWEITEWSHASVWSVPFTCKIHSPKLVLHKVSFLHSASYFVNFFLFPLTVSLPFRSIISSQMKFHSQSKKHCQLCMGGIHLQAFTLWNREIDLKIREVIRLVGNSETNVVCFPQKVLVEMSFGNAPSPPTCCYSMWNWDYMLCKGQASIFSQYCTQNFY